MQRERGYKTVVSSLAQQAADAERRYLQHTFHGAGHETAMTFGTGHKFWDETQEYQDPTSYMQEHKLTRKSTEARLSKAAGLASHSGFKAMSADARR